MHTEDVGPLRKKIYAFTMAAALLLLCACGGERGPAETVDPYEGMVEVESGFGTKMWVQLYEDVPASTLTPADFVSDGGFISYTGSEYEALRGIDVSEHQGEIDWKGVASEGVDFAMIRAGYRGYSQGGLYEDAYFLPNIDGAAANGIDIGVYFFSQAVTPEEAVEEAEYLLKLIQDYRLEVTMPVVFDWENIDNDDARTDGLDGAALTDCAAAFCERIRQAGYEPAVYAYRYLAYFLYDLPRLKDYTLWIGAVGEVPDFYYKHDIWQYSAGGTVKGIDGPVDLNLYFRDRQDGELGSAQPSPEPETGGGSAPAPEQDTPAPAPDTAIAPAAESAAGQSVSANAEVIIYDAGGEETVYGEGSEEKFSCLIEYDA